MKKVMWIILIILIVVIESLFVVISYKGKNTNTTIPNNYIMVFKGEDGVTVHSTYIYKVKKKKKTTYKYINTITTYFGKDSAQTEEKITKKGKIKKLKKALEIAKKNKAYSYVKYEDKHIYSISEYKEKFQ